MMAREDVQVFHHGQRIQDYHSVDILSKDIKQITLAAYHQTYTLPSLPTGQKTPKSVKTIHIRLTGDRNIVVRLLQLRLTNLLIQYSSQSKIHSLRMHQRAAQVHHLLGRHLHGPVQGPLAPVHVNLLD